MGLVALGFFNAFEQGFKAWIGDVSLESFASPASVRDNPKTNDTHCGCNLQDFDDRLSHPVHYVHKDGQVTKVAGFGRSWGGDP